MPPRCGKLRARVGRGSPSFGTRIMPPYTFLFRIDRYLYSQGNGRTIYARTEADHLITFLSICFTHSTPYSVLLNPSYRLTFLLARRVVRKTRNPLPATLSSMKANRTETHTYDSWYYIGFSLTQISLLPSASTL
jgi:hypothetical protein